MRQLNMLGEQAVIIQLLPFFMQNQNKMLGSEVSDNLHIIQKLGFQRKKSKKDNKIDILSQLHGITYMLIESDMNVCW